MALTLGEKWARDISSLYAGVTASTNGWDQASVDVDGGANKDSDDLGAYELSYEYSLLAESGQGFSKQPQTAETRRSIYITSTTVLCLAQQGFQPTGKPVVAKGKRPAGVAVFGVSGLGLGVRDGDIVTEILGQPVRSVAQGITLIFIARASNRPTITGTVWHAMRPSGVTVEQPYTMPNCSAQESDCWKSHCEQDKKSKAKPRAGDPASAQR